MTSSFMFEFSELLNYYKKRVRMLNKKVKQLYNDDNDLCVDYNGRLEELKDVVKDLERLSK
jgi:hypothetical protein